MPTTRRLAVVAAVAAVAGFWPAAVFTARAQEGWSHGTTAISAITATGGLVAAPRVAVNSTGDALAVWIERDPTGLGAVKGARYTAATATWSASVTVSGFSAKGARTARVAIDAAGSGVAIWDEGSISISSAIKTSRYDAAMNTWGAPELRSLGLTPAGPSVALTPSGDGIAVWVEPSGVAPPGVFASRFTVATGTWSAAMLVTSDTASTVTLAEDDQGNAVIAWQSAVGMSIRTSRFTATTATWSTPVDLSAAVPGPAVAFAAVAMNAAGDAVVAWSRSGVVEAARAPAGLAFGASVPVSPADGVNEAARVAIDPAANVVVTWTRSVGAVRVTQVSRYDVLAAAWSAPTDFGEPGFAYQPAAVAADASGNALVLWSRSVASPGIRMLAARYAAPAGTWTTATNLSEIGRSAANSDVGFDAAGNALAVWFETQQGFGVIQARRWVATAAPPTVAAVVPAAGQLAATVTVPPAVEAGFVTTSLDYSLDGGISWTPRTPPGVGSPLVITGLTDGVVYDLRVRAVNAAGGGRASTSLLVRSGSGATPADLRVVLRTGNTVTFAWVPPAAGVVPDGYLIEGSLAGHPQVLASVPTGGPATQVTLTVPNGTFDVWVAAVYGGLRLGQTAPLQIAVNTVAFPSSPVNLLVSAAGDTLALSWTNTWSGATLTGLQLLVGGAVNATIALPVTESFAYSGVPPGTYTFAVTALNGGAPGGATSSAQVTFPGTCAGPPNPPTAFSLTTQGGRVYLDWLPPSSGAAVTSYQLIVSGAFNGVIPMTGRSLAVPVPAGVYTVRVAAVGHCGTSAPTAVQTVTVP